MVNIYYESDFIAIIKLPQDVSNTDFSLDFYTSGLHPVSCYKQGDIMSPNLMVDGDKYKVIFRNHRLQPGDVTVKFRYISTEGLTLATRFAIPYRLTRNKSDVIALPEISIICMQNTSEESTPPTEEMSSFVPVVQPSAGNITTEKIKTMQLSFPSPILEFIGENVRLSKNFGNVWYDYAAEGIISEDRLSMTIIWDFAPTEGVTYTLELPDGCIVLENGAKNLETKIAYTIIPESKED